MRWTVDDHPALRRSQRARGGLCLADETRGQADEDRQDLPWLALDPGVNLEVNGPARLADDPTEYVEVKLTFDTGVGDTPDDYYALLIDHGSRRLAGTRYVVTYEAILPEGAESSPERTLVYDEMATVEGLVVPTAYTVYAPDGSVYATCTAQDWSFSRPFDESRLDMPEDGVVDDSTP